VANYKVSLLILFFSTTVIRLIAFRAEYWHLVGVARSPNVSAVERSKGVQWQSCPASRETRARRLNASADKYDLSINFSLCVEKKNTR
jgi:hypothetical protein